MQISIQISQLVHATLLALISSFKHDTVDPVIWPFTTSSKVTSAYHLTGYARTLALALARAVGTGAGCLDRQ